MRKVIITLLLSVLIQSASALSWHAVNIDYKTIAAMSAAYLLENTSESKTTEAFDSVASNYKSVALAMAGIYESKKKDRDAMRNPGLMAAEENYYYKRIYGLVKDGIMPKFLTVALAMVKYPENALHWGPYLYKTTTNVKNLCQEFELLCTNGKLSFKDIQFLVINEKLEKLFNLAKLGDVDWKTMLNKMASFGKDISKDDIKEDMNKLGNVLAQAGQQTVNSNLQKISKIGNIFHASTNEIWEMYDKFRDTYKDIKNGSNVKDVLLSVIGTPDVSGLEKLFQVDDYNLTGYISNYIKNLQDKYYTQRWYICAENSGSKVLVSYTPPYEASWSNDPSSSSLGTNENWAKNGWLECYSGERDNSSAHASLTTTQAKTLKEQALSKAGWSSSKISSYESENSGHKLTVTYTLNHKDVGDKYKTGWKHHYHYVCMYAYSVTIVDTWNVKEEVYEDTFDSQDMDLDAFKDKLKIKMKQLQADADDDETNKYHGYTFELKSDSPKYYEMADERKMQGCNTVSFIANCNEGANLAEGNFSWKENGNQGKSLEDPKSKNFAMDATSSSSDGDSELLKKQESVQKEITSLNSQIATKEEQMSELVDKIWAAKQAKNETLQSQYQKQYNKLASEVSDLKLQLSFQKQQLEDINNALDDYYEDLDDELDDKYRIPTNMQELKSMYRLQWQDDGEWVNGSSEYIFTRHAYYPDGKCNVTYTATLTLSRKPSYFLGIRTHRAILSVEFKLASSGSSENVVEVMDLDMSKTEKQRAEEVNAKLKELMEDLPDCSISLKYEYANTVETSSDDEDGIHLLWACDRLDVARYVEAELTKIYAQLVFIEHVMQYRESILDFLKHQILDVVERGQRGTIAQYALERWQNAGDAAMKKSKATAKNG